MKKTKLLGSLLIIGSMLSVGVLANTALTEVKAHFNANMTYELNGEKVMEGKGAVILDGATYVPLRAAAETLGLEVDYKPGQITMKNAEVVDKATEEANTPAVEGTGDLSITVDLNAQNIEAVPEGVVADETTEQNKADNLTDADISVTVDVTGSTTGQLSEETQTTEVVVDSQAN